MSPIIVAPLAFIILEGAHHFSPPFAFGLASGVLVMGLLRLAELRTGKADALAQGGDHA